MGQSYTNNGYNPLRWDCNKRGCFNIKKRPKIEIFADCFPGKINFGDVDGLVEVNSNFLFLEWKESATKLSTGQYILYKKLSLIPAMTVFLIAGSPETMVVTHRAWFLNGKFENWHPYTLEQAKKWIRKWVSFTSA